MIALRHQFRHAAHAYFRGSSHTQYSQWHSTCSGKLLTRKQIRTFSQSEIGNQSDKIMSRRALANSLRESLRFDDFDKTLRIYDTIKANGLLPISLSLFNEFLYKAAVRPHIGKIVLADMEKYNLRFLHCFKLKDQGLEIFSFFPLKTTGTISFQTNLHLWRSFEVRFFLLEVREEQVCELETWELFMAKS